MSIPIPVPISYLDIREKAIMTFSTRWMKLEDIMPREISQAEKDKCCII